MRLSVNSTSEDLIVEPIEEAVALYDDMLKELSKSMVRNPLFNCFHTRPVAASSRIPSGDANLFTHHVCATYISKDPIRILPRDFTNTAIQENRRNEPGRSQGFEFTMFTIDNGLQVSNTANQMRE